MSQRIVDFLVDLSKDPYRVEDYKRDPDAVLAAADLSEEDREILRGNDVQKIHEILGRHGHHQVMIFVVVTRTNG